MVVCVADGRSSDAVLTELRAMGDGGGEDGGWVAGGKDGRCGWSVVERIGSGKGWCGTVRMVAASWKSRARRGWLAGERVVGERARVVARPALFRTGVYTYIHLFGT